MDVGGRRGLPLFPGLVRWDEVQAGTAPGGDSFSVQAQVILLAMQHYGLILADNGSNWYFSGTEDAAWPSSLLSELKTVPAAQFEAVDESSLMIDPNSAAARPTLRRNSGDGRAGHDLAPQVSPLSGSPQLPAGRAAQMGMASAGAERADASNRPRTSLTGIDGLRT